MKRIAQIRRKTKETDITISLNLDGKGKARLKTGIGFLNHMLELFAYHGLFDLNIEVKRQDLDVDVHHTNEDIGICLGQALKKALGRKKGIARYGTAFVPMEEALAKVRAVLDISGRPSCYLKIRGRGDTGAPGYNIRHAEHFFKAFANASGINIHIDILKGEDFHHSLESVFKALGRALSEAVKIDKRRQNKVPSTKGRL